MKICARCHKFLFSNWEVIESGPDMGVYWCQPCIVAHQEYIKKLDEKAKDLNTNEVKE